MKGFDITVINVDKFVKKCLSQEGDKYVFGHEVSLSDTDPDAFDCSELIEWAAYQVGVQPRVPDGSWYQARHCLKYDTLIPVSEGVDTYGALLFRFSSSPFSGGRPTSSHVAVSLGDGRTIEARGSRYGVGVFNAVGRGWTHAGLVPGVNYETGEEVNDVPLSLDEQEVDDVLLSLDEQKELKRFLNELRRIDSNVTFVRYLIPWFREQTRGKK